MRILIYGANLSSVKHDTLGGLDSKAIYKHYITTQCILLKDGSEIYYGVINSESDVYRYKGIHFDWVVEHSSFRGPYDLHALIHLHLVR